MEAQNTIREKLKQIAADVTDVILDIVFESRQKKNETEKTVETYDNGKHDTPDPIAGDA